MIIDLLANADRYISLHPDFARAFAFLKRDDLRDLTTGRYDIDGDRVFAIVARDQGRNKEGSRLEIHRKYIDIQMVLAGTDEMGWLPISSCTESTGPFDAEKDIGFFDDLPSAWFPVEPGMFAIFYPEDAHLPLISSGEIHKVIVKIAVSEGPV
ncbi:MAG: YhcH/YjgK/YiaL family protein [Syntrophotaleaceae bacterium]